MSRYFYFALMLFTVAGLAQSKTETHVTGVYQGKTLFIQNPYQPKSKSFCVKEVFINSKRLDYQLNRSAIKIDFEGVDLFSPVTVLLKHDSLCEPIIINPDAVKYYSMFSFQSLCFNDSTINWKTRGEKGQGRYVVEKFNLGIWEELESVASKEQYSESTYSIFPQVDEGPNKVRIKYETTDGKYLYSRELDFHYYPDPVTFTPTKTSRTLTMSRAANYEIFDAGGTLVLTGQGQTIDVSVLPPGDYVVYFDNKDPGVFSRLKN